MAARPISTHHNIDDVIYEFFLGTIIGYNFVLVVVFFLFCFVFCFFVCSFVCLFLLLLLILIFSEHACSFDVKPSECRIGSFQLHSKTQKAIRKLNANTEW